MVTSLELSRISGNNHVQAAKALRTARPARQARDFETDFMLGSALTEEEIERATHLAYGTLVLRPKIPIIRRWFLGLARESELAATEIRRSESGMSAP
jgi:hypothetical protein